MPELVLYTFRILKFVSTHLFLVYESSCIHVNYPVICRSTKTMVVFNENAFNFNKTNVSTLSLNTMKMHRINNEKVNLTLIDIRHRLEFTNVLTLNDTRECLNEYAVK